MTTQNANQEANSKIIKLEDFFKIQLKVFKLIGLNVIPLKAASVRAKVLDKLMRWYFYACIISIFVLIIQFSVKLVIDINKFDVVLRILPSIILFPYNCSKGILFFVHRKRVLKIIEKLQVSFPSTQTAQQSSKMDNHLNLFVMIYKIYILFYSVTMTSAMSEVIYLLIFKKIRQFPLEIWFPYDYNANNLIFISTLVLSFWAISNACVNVIAADFFIFAIVDILVLEFKIVGENIKKAINAKEVSSLRALLVQHQELIDISNDIKSLFSFIFFYTFIQGAVSIASSGFQLITAPTISVLLYSLSYAAVPLTQVFLYCHFGEKLITESAGVSETILDSNWYHLDDIKVKKSILLIIVRTQKACTLSGYGLVSLSIETLSNVS